MNDYLRIDAALSSATTALDAVSESPRLDAELLLARALDVPRSYLFAHPDDAMDLDAALASLPDVSRAVVWLHDVEGFTHKEIASLMGKTESFSKSQLSRAYQRLRPMLEVNEHGEQPEGAAMSY